MATRAQKSRRDEGVFVDNIRIVIDWSRWEEGMSVFVPCIDVEDLRRQMHRKARVYGYTLTTKECIENQQFGVRFWRCT